MHHITKNTSQNVIVQLIEFFFIEISLLSKSLEFKKFMQ